MVLTGTIRHRTVQHLLGASRPRALDGAALDLYHRRLDLQTQRIREKLQAFSPPRTPRTSTSQGRRLRVPVRGRIARINISGYVSLMASPSTSTPSLSSTADSTSDPSCTDEGAQANAVDAEYRAAFEALEVLRRQFAEARTRQAHLAEGIRREQEELEIDQRHFAQVLGDERRYFEQVEKPALAARIIQAAFRSSQERRALTAEIKEFAVVWRRCNEPVGDPADQ